MNFDKNGVLRSNNRLVKVGVKMCKRLRLWSEKGRKAFAQCLTHTRTLKGLFPSLHNKRYE